MSSVRPRRRSRVAASASAVFLAASALTFTAPTAAQAVALTGSIAVTSPSSGKVAAATTKQVVLLTVSGSGVPALTEDNVASVDLGAGTGCTGLTNYVVTSATTLSIKTPSPNGCLASPSGAEPVVITFANTDTLTKTGIITFVTPPDVATTKPIIAENSAGQALAANQNIRFWSTGGQIVRVKAGAGYAFDPRTTAGLKVNLGGKDGSEIKVYNTSDQLMTAGTASDVTVNAAVGNYFTFKTASGMDPANDNLIITQNGVNKTFLGTATGADVVTGEQITSIAPDYGRSTGGSTIVITGTGFSKTNADYGNTVNVTVCGVNATFPTAPALAVNTAGTQITAIVPAVSNVSPGLGVGTFAGTCPVRIVNTSVSAPFTSPITPGSYFVALNE